MSDFVVKRTQYQVKDLSSDLEKLLLKKFCTHAAAVIKLQCGREYFPDDSTASRATQISSLSELEQGLPTNNLLPERDFSVFDRLSRVAKMANRKFSGKNIRNDMTLLHHNPELTITAKKSVSDLASREAQWKNEQMQLKYQNDARKSEKAKGVHAYQNRVLANCKTWGGPCISENDLDNALIKAENESFLVKQELIYYKLTHPTEFSGNKHLFRIRGVSDEEMMTNLRCILSNEEDMNLYRSKVGRLPTDNYVLKALLATSGDDIHQAPRQKLEVFINSVVAVTWVVNDKKTWYLGYIIDISKDQDDTYIVNHLERVHPERNELWCYPKREDILKVDLMQIICINPDYEWDVQNIRTQKMILKNHKVIDEAITG